MRVRNFALAVALLGGVVSGLDAAPPAVPTPNRGVTSRHGPTVPPQVDALPPPVLTVTQTSPIYDYQKISLPMRIDNYPFRELDLNALPHELGDFIKIRGITYAAPNPRRDQHGGISFSVIGYFIGTGSRVLLRLSSRETGQEGYVTLSAEVRKSPQSTYTVTNTWSLRSKFNPQLLGSGLGSFCDGQPPIGTALGIVEYDGKLSFLGRSGPVGTACVFGLKELVAHDGVVSAGWKVIRSGPGEQCKASANLAFNATRGTVTVDESGRYSGDPLLYSDSREVSDSGVVYATGNTDPVTVLKPTIIQYSCPITLGSDVRTIRFVLEQVTLQAPPGRRFP